MRNIHENLHIEGRHFAIFVGALCFGGLLFDVTRLLECLKYSLNSMVLCYDLSLCSKKSTILFGFYLLSFVFYGNMRVYNVGGFASLTR